MQIKTSPHPLAGKTALLVAVVCRGKAAVLNPRPHSSVKPLLSSAPARTLPLSPDHFFSHTLCTFHLHAHLSAQPHPPRVGCLIIVRAPPGSLRGTAPPGSHRKSATRTLLGPLVVQSGITPTLCILWNVQLEHTANGSLARRGRDKFREPGMLHN